MPTVMYPAYPVFDPATGEPLLTIRGQAGRVVQRGTETDLTLVDSNGLTMAQPLYVTDLGFLPTFGVVEGLTQVDFISGDVRMPIWSPTGLEQSAAESAADADTSRVAAETSAIAAQEAATLVGAPADSAVAALVSGPTQTRSALYTALTTTATRPVGKGELFVNASDYGVVADGTTDDSAALTTALAAGAALSAPVRLPRGKTIGLGAIVEIPAGTTLYTMGSSFTATQAIGRSPYLWFRGANVHVVGGIRLTTLGGAQSQGVTISDTSDIHIDAITVTSGATGAGSGNLRDNGLRISASTRINLGTVAIKNYDYSLFAEGVSGLRVDAVSCDTYLCAVHLRDVPGLRINSGWTSGISPNATYAPGANGVLLEATVAASDMRISNFTSKDSREHGFRISGPAAQSDLWLTDCASMNAGGSGFKILGSTREAGVYNESIYLTNCLAEDSGNINQNTCGFLVQMAKKVQILNPIIRRRNKTVSATEGIRLTGVYDVSVQNPMILDAFSFGIRVDEEYGNVSDVRVRNAAIRCSTGHGIYLQNPGVDFRNIDLEAFVDSTATSGAIFYAGRYTNPTDSGTWSGNLRAAIRANPDHVVSFINTNSSTTALAAFYVDFVGKKTGTYIAKNGSMWLDITTGTRQLAKVGAWATL